MNSNEGTELTPISKSSEILFSITSTFSPKIKLFEGHGTCHIWGNEIYRIEYLEHKSNSS